MLGTFLKYLASHQILGPKINQDWVPRTIWGCI